MTPDLLDRCMPGGDDDIGAAQVAHQDAGRVAAQREQQRAWARARAWADHAHRHAGDGQ